jgi:hypothetical protein
VETTTISPPIRTLRYITYRNFRRNFTKFDIELQDEQSSRKHKFRENRCSRRYFNLPSVVNYFSSVFFTVISLFSYKFKLELFFCRSQWPRRLRRGSAAARLLGLWVRIPPGHGWKYLSIFQLNFFYCSENRRNGGNTFLMDV